jgi:hypothetical protein
MQGLDFDVSADFAKCDDFLASVSNSSIIAWDNVESVPDDLINLLCTVATGGLVTMRKLYSNSDMVSVRPRCAVIINARTDRFLAKRPDLADRLLPINLEPIKSKVGEEDIYEELALLRDHFWTQFLDESVGYIRNLKSSERGEGGTIEP